LIVDARTLTAHRVAILEAFEVVLRDPHALLDCLLESTDADGACAAIVARFGVSDVAARVVMDMQIRRFTELDRQRITDELAQRRAELAALPGEA
jgi:DNA gyrase subunit A